MTNPKTKEYIEIFKKITGISPKSARVLTGSMKGYVMFNIRWSEKVFNFVEEYYKNGRHILSGVYISYIGNIFDDLEWHKKHGYRFDVEIKRLNKE